MSELWMMSNSELLERTASARDAAHNAPLAEWSKDHRGHSAIVKHTSAWSRASRDYFQLLDEVARRGLPSPPALIASHQDRKNHHE